MSSLFVDQLTTLDFSYLCPTQGLVGETWLVDLILSGHLDAEGMLFDFGAIKTEIKSQLEAWVDHCLLVPALCDAVSVHNAQGTTEARIELDQGEQIHCRAPAASIVDLPVAAITPELLTPLACKHIEPVLPDNITGVQITLYPQTIEGAWYRYSHGLKKHKGNCQRIAHGHRSRLRVDLDGQRQEPVERRIAQQWDTVYLGSREDITSQETIDGQQYYRFSYRSRQGDFMLQLPASHCHLMDTDTTVEHIANHLAAQVAHENPGCNVRVLACEGYRKGAIGTRSPLLQTAQPVTS